MNWDIYYYEIKDRRIWTLIKGTIRHYTISNYEYTVNIQLSTFVAANTQYYKMTTQSNTMLGSKYTQNDYI